MDKHERDGKVVMTLRIARRMSRPELARAAGITAPELTAIEKKGGPLGDLERHRLLRAMGLPFTVWERTAAFVEKLERDIEEWENCAEAEPGKGPGSVV